MRSVRAGNGHPTGWGANASIAPSAMAAAFGRVSPYRRSWGEITPPGADSARARFETTSDALPFWVTGTNRALTRGPAARRTITRSRGAGAEVEVRGAGPSDQGRRALVCAVQDVGELLSR